MIDLARLARAIHLTPRPLMNGTSGWEVNGHVVYPDADTARCDCADHRYRQVECAHLLAVRLADEIDQDLREALRGLIPAPQPRGASK